MLLRNYKYRIYPTTKQKIRLEKQFEICKNLHNDLLEVSKETYKCSGVSITSRKELYQVSKELKESYNFQGYSQVLQNVADKLNKSYSAFFRRIKEKQKGKNIKVGYPRFKKKINSITYPQSNAFKFKNQRRLQVSQIGSIPIELHRIPKGTPKTLTIKKVPSGKWFVNFSCEIEDKTNTVKHKYPENKVGIDLGLTDFATFSDGTVIENPRFLKKSESKLKREHRRLSKKKNGSKNKEKQRIKLARSYEYLTNQRMDFLHKLSHHITQHYSFISTENLGVSNMVKNHNLAKSISDVGWSIFTGMLTYKVSSTGSEKVEVDRFYPSSQICNKCKHKQKMPLHKRVYKCENCGAEIPRDKNASKNILEEGLKINTVGRTEIHACGDLTSIDKSKDLLASRIAEAGTICSKPQ